MRLEPTADNRSPWYETFTPPAAWVWAPSSAAPEAVTETAAAEAAQPSGADEDWATAALFDCYNG